MKFTCYNCNAQTIIMSFTDKKTPPSEEHQAELAEFTKINGEYYCKKCVRGEREYDPKEEVDLDITSDF